MGQELKIWHCVLKIKVNTNLIVRTGPNKAYIILQLEFYHHSGSSNSESHAVPSPHRSSPSPWPSSPSPVQVLKKSDSSPTWVQVQDSGLESYNSAVNQFILTLIWQKLKRMSLTNVVVAVVKWQLLEGVIRTTWATQLLPLLELMSRIIQQ